MKKILTAILLSLVISACSCMPEYVYLGTKIEKPAHKTLNALTQEEVKQIPKPIRKKLEQNKAMLIGNIKQLEHRIDSHNKTIKTVGGSN